MFFWKDKTSGITCYHHMLKDNNRSNRTRCEICLNSRGSWWESKQNIFKISQEFKISTQVLSCEIWKNFLEHLFSKSFSDCFWGLTHVFQRNSEQKSVRLSVINTRFSWKKGICCSENPEAATLVVL